MSSMLVILTYKIVTVHMANIKGPPRAEKSEVRHVVKLGDTVKIRCPIQGFPPPMVHWTINDNTITYAWSRFKINRKSLKIKGVEEQDKGVYICKGINVSTVAYIAAYLIVIEPAEVPANLG